MKLGIAGSGKIVQEALPMLSQLPMEKIILCGREQSKDKLLRLKNQYGLSEVVYSYEDLLASDIDTVYLALPNDMHFDCTMQAIEAGKHIILEKPAVPELAQLKVLRDAAKQHHVFLVEAMNVHHLPMYRVIRDLLPEIGELKIISLNFSQYSSRYDNFKKGIIAPAFDPKNYGGALMDLNVYNIHFLCGLFGKPLSYTYTANIERNVDTSGILSLTYPGFQVSAIAAKDCSAPMTSTIQGTKGTILFFTSVNEMKDVRLVMNDGTTREYHSDPAVYRLKYEFEAFMRMIDENNPEEAERLMDISELAAEILQNSAAQAGLKFGE